MSPTPCSIPEFVTEVKILIAIETLPEPSIPITTPFRPGLGFLTATLIIAAATICLALVIASAIFAPWLTPHDPQLLAPALRLKPASADYLLGTDAYGRDLLSRILYRGRQSPLVGPGPPLTHGAARTTPVVAVLAHPTGHGGPA